jgi:hypothetical protein
VTPSGAVADSDLSESERLELDLLVDCTVTCGVSSVAAPAALAVATKSINARRLGIARTLLVAPRRFAMTFVL